MVVWEKKRRWKVVGWGLAGLVVVIGVFATGVYAFSWHGPATRSILRILPLPVASVGWSPIPWSVFLEYQESFRRYGQALNQASPELFPPLPADEPRRQALEKLLRDHATFALASRQGVAVAEVDVDQAFTAQLAQGGGREATEKGIRDLYGWTPQEFKQHVLRVAVARTKLREQLSFDTELIREVRQEAERVYELTKSGQQSFSELAVAFSQDDQADAGGDMGWVAPGEQNKEIDEVAFALKVGETSELIHTKFGFHILKLEAEREEAGQRQVQLRQIFFAAPSVDALITDFLNQQRVRIFITGLEWNSKSGRVEAQYPD